MPHPSKETTEPAAIDQQVLLLRRTGKSFATIARTLSLGKAREANAAFLRAVRGAKPAERKELCDEELGRLQQLENRVREAPDVAPFDRDKQLDVIKFLRKQLLEN